MGGGGHRHCKANAHVAARAGIYGGVDAHQQAIGIYQRATRIAGVNGGIGLNEILKGVDAQLFATQRAHNARGDGLTDAKGIANGQNGIAHLQGFHLTQDNDGQLG